MKVKELLSKGENVGYILREENGNEINCETLSTEEENNLLKQNVIDFTIEKDFLSITIELPKPKEKITYTPKFQIGELVYKCDVDTITGDDTNGLYFNLYSKKIAKTKINEIAITKDEILYGVNGFGCLNSENSLFKTKEELLNSIINKIKNAIDKLDDLE